MVMDNPILAAQKAAFRAGALTALENNPSVKALPEAVAKAIEAGNEAVKKTSVSEDVMSMHDKQGALSSAFASVVRRMIDPSSVTPSDRDAAE